MKKRTLICIHVMPSEIEMFERLMIQFHKAFQYLDGNDDVTLKVTLNLNPELTDWKNSELKQEYFIRRFNLAFEGLPNINEIITDDSLWGTTQQKRESVKLDYDQFVFCDTDISFSPKLLKYQLNISYQLNDMYVISPSLPKWWDESWAVLTHRDFLDKELGYAHSIAANDSAPMQDIDKIEAKQLTGFKKILGSQQNCSLFGFFFFGKKRHDFGTLPTFLGRWHARFTKQGLFVFCLRVGIFHRHTQSV